MAIPSRGATPRSREDGAVASTMTLPTARPAIRRPRMTLMDRRPLVVIIMSLIVVVVVIVVVRLRL